MLKSAEEVARELIRGPHDNAFWPDESLFAHSVGDDGGRVYLSNCTTPQEAEEECDELVAVLERLVERSRAEGAAAERERLAAYAGRPAEEVAAEMVVGPRVDGLGQLYNMIDDGEAELYLQAHDEARVAHGCRLVTVALLTRLITRERAAARAELEAEVERLRAELATSEERRAKWGKLANDAVNRHVDAAAEKLRREAAECPEARR